MTAYVTALRILTWTAVVSILFIATITAVTNQDWCPTGVNPVACVEDDGQVWP